MSFRRAFISISIAGALLAALVAWSLFIITTREQRLSESLELAAEGANAAHALERSLFVHQRASALSLFQPSPEHERARIEAERALEDWFATAGRYVGSEHEGRLLLSAMRDVEHYRIAWRKVPASSLESFENSIANRELRRASASVAALAEENRRQLLEVRRELGVWNRRAVRLGMGVGLALLTFTVAGIVSVRASLYRAFVSIRDALSNFEVGRTKLLIERGPKELRALAHNFNSMSETLAERRRSQFGFLAAVAHDMRTPLAAMQLAAERLGGLDDPKLRSTAQLIARQINTLARLAEDLLDTTRIEAGQLELQEEPTDLVPLLRQCVALFCEASSEHEVRLRTPPSLWVYVDPARIRQVLNNLLSNAIKYSPQGGHVDVEAAREQTRVVVRVIDAGMGIPPEEQDRVFEPFRRSRGAAHVAPGVGLGLAVARDLMEAHGGALVLERSAPGVGTTFRLDLPTEVPAGARGATFG